MRYALILLLLCGCGTVEADESTIFGVWESVDGTGFFSIAPDTSLHIATAYVGVFRTKAMIRRDMLFIDEYIPGCNGYRGEYQFQVYGDAATLVNMPGSCAYGIHGRWARARP